MTPRPRVSAAALLALAALILGPPAAAAAIAIAHSLTTTPTFNLPALLHGLAAAALIATLATLLAWPAAFALRRRWPILAIALLWPSFLAYAGWGVLRGPNTALGNLLATHHLTATASHIQAILGLALYAWPLAALVIALRTQRLDPTTLDALRLDARSTLSRLRELATITAPAAAAAWLIIAALMLGSAVPLHLAQLETTAIALWRQLDATPPSRQGEVWISAAPLLITALLAALALARWIATPTESPLAAPPPSRRADLTLAALLALSALAPLALLATLLGSPHTLITVARLSAQPLASSIAVAAALAAIAAALTLLTWRIATAHPALARLTLAAFLTAALVPGIMLGSAAARAHSTLATTLHLEPLLDTWLPAILGQAARLGFLPIAVGMILARSEPRDLADLRSLDRATTARGWLHAAVRPHLHTLAAVAAATACLSLHEIEATIMLEPPTRSGGSFARLTLQHLHYSRTAEMAASVLILFGLGVVILLIPLAVRITFGSSRPIEPAARR